MLTAQALTLLFGQERFWADGAVLLCVVFIKLRRTSRHPRFTYRTATTSKCHRLLLA